MRSSARSRSSSAFRSAVTSLAEQPTPSSSPSPSRTGKKLVTHTRRTPGSSERSPASSRSSTGLPVSSTSWITGSQVAPVLRPELEQGAAEQLARGQAVHLLERLVHPYVAQVGVPEREADRHGAKHALDEGRRLARALLGTHGRRDVADHADRERDAAVGVIHRIRAYDRPALLPGRDDPVADDPLRGLAGERSPARAARPTAAAGAPRRGSRTGRGRPRAAQSRNSSLVSKPTKRAAASFTYTSLPVLGLHDEPLVDRAHDRGELVARGAQPLLRLRAHGRRREVARDVVAEQHLGVAPVVRLVVVEREPAEQAAAVDEGDGGERPDALVAKRALELFRAAPRAPRSLTSTGSGRPRQASRAAASRRSPGRPQTGRARPGSASPERRRRAARPPGRPRWPRAGRSIVSANSSSRLVARPIASATRYSASTSETRRRSSSRSETSRAVETMYATPPVVPAIGVPVDSTQTQSRSCRAGAP